VWFSQQPATVLDRVEQAFELDFVPRPPITGNPRTDVDAMSFQGQESYTRRRFDFFLPRGVAGQEGGMKSAWHMCMRPQLLGTPLAYRTSRDGYMSCGTFIRDGFNCVVYSLGSNDQFDFEDAVLQKSNCSVHTFDCTSKPPPKQLSHRHHFHDICIGASTSGSAKLRFNFKPLQQVMSELGHSRLSAMKWDVEGFEYDLFRELLRDKGRLPREAMFEIHYRSHMRARTPWHTREIHAGELAVAAIDLYDAGYRVISSKPNSGCSSCFEYTLLRTRCPLELPAPTTSEGRLKPAERHAAHSHNRTISEH